MRYFIRLAIVVFILLVAYFFAVGPYTVSLSSDVRVQILALYLTLSVMVLFAMGFFDVKRIFS